VKKVTAKGGAPAAGRKPAVQNRTPKKDELPKWVAAFISALAQSGNISEACKDAEIGRQTAYDLREKSEEFASLWRDALDEACDALEKEARRRAKDGVVNTIFYKGEPIGEEHQYSDTLMIFLLKAHRPEVYRERMESLNITLTADELANLPDEQLDELINKLSRRR
jgi:hypothetical protein